MQGHPGAPPAREAPCGAPRLSRAGVRPGRTPGAPLGGGGREPAGPGGWGRGGRRRDRGAGAGAGGLPGESHSAAAAAAGAASGDGPGRGDLTWTSGGRGPGGGREEAPAAPAARARSSGAARRGAGGHGRGRRSPGRDRRPGPVSPSWSSGRSLPWEGAPCLSPPSGRALLRCPPAHGPRPSRGGPPPTSPSAPLCAARCPPDPFGCAVPRGLLFVPTGPPAPTPSQQPRLPSPFLTSDSKTYSASRPHPGRSPLGPLPAPATRRRSSARAHPAPGALHPSSSSPTHHGAPRPASPPSPRSRPGRGAQAPGWAVLGPAGEAGVAPGPGGGGAAAPSPWHCRHCC